MRAQSFELVLRDTTAPAPNPLVRLAAKQAALVEFAQFQALRLERAGRDLRSRENATAESGQLENVDVEGGAGTGPQASPQYPRSRPTSFRRPAIVNLLAGALSACIPAFGMVVLWSDGASLEFRPRIWALEAKAISEPAALVLVAELPLPIIETVHLEPPAFSIELADAPGKVEAMSELKPSAAFADTVDIPSESMDGDRFHAFETNPIKRVADEPVSTFSVDVDTASYTYVRRALSAGILPPRDAVRAEEMINYFDYSWPAPTSPDEAFRAAIAVNDSPWTPGNKLIHIGIKGYELPPHEQPDVNLVLLIDVSGSMASADRLPLVQQSFGLLLRRLKPYDTVAIVTYAGDTRVALPPTPVREWQEILDALRALRAGGGTDGESGIRAAYELAGNNFRQGGVNRVLLATDGDFNVGITDVEDLKKFVARERGKGIFLSVLGFGASNYNDEMAQALAQNGNGVAAYVDSGYEAQKVLVREATSSLFTIAKDVKLQVEFNPATVTQYRLVGYETRALRREDFENDAVDAGDIGSGHRVTAIYELTPAAPATATAPATASNTQTYGRLLIRYKQPDGRTSRLIEQPILINPPPLSPTLQRDVELATAVAGFAQLLRGGTYTGALTYKDVVRQAEAAAVNDPNGYRGEFLQLVEEAQQMAARGGGD